MSETILISTHDLDTAGELRQAFEADDFEVDLVTPKERLSERADAALLIITGGSGADDVAELVDQARSNQRLPVFMLFDEADAQRRKAVARKLDLTETFAKPVDPGDVMLLGTRAVKRRRLQEITGIVGETDAIREALERVVQIAPVTSTVLITGESGTGKELVARGIHALSPRRNKSFIAVNVAALSETLLESELFGHEKGAFTGAIDSRRGLFELADGGTIFLDEIGEMPLATQTKLLRVLEQREFLRVGGERSLKVDVRVITATNQNLRQLVAVGDFRRDLYYRLNVLSIELPPLRERRKDIPLLVREFVREVAGRLERPFVGISEKAMEILMDYRWPGNIRELRNLVESMVVLAPGREIQPEDIPPEIRSPRPSGKLLPASPVETPSELVAPSRREGPGSEERSRLRPELVEFIFRTLVELRVDLDDLRKDFDVYKQRLEDGESFVPLVSPEALEVVSRRGEEEMADEVAARILEGRGPGGEGEGVGEAGGPGEESGEGVPAAVDEEAEEEGTVVFRPGMTMEDMEREAIAAALDEVEGNRRKAAELLGIGERTLYRKIRKFDLAD